MNRKDRIAVVVSVIYLMFSMLLVASTNHEKSGAMLIVFLTCMLPLCLYWGYRFIKNDISFIKLKGE